MVLYVSIRQRMPFPRSILLIILLLPFNAFADEPETTKRDEQTLLTFTHTSTGSHYINAVYKNGKMYLPVSELLGLLMIPHEKGTEDFSLQGEYVPGNRKWIVNPSSGLARSGEDGCALKSGDYHIGDMDLFLLPRLFKFLFGLEFRINPKTLNVVLENECTIPAKIHQQQEKLRRELKENKNHKTFSPLLFPRDRKWLAPGMLDYVVSAQHSSSGNRHVHYTFTGGSELFGGDIEGILNGTTGNKPSRPHFSGLRWQYAFEPNPFATALKVGKLSPLARGAPGITGFSITNNPVLPRQTFDTCQIEGHTIPGSVVEFYVNTILKDYTTADELGYYRFDYPVSYGSVRISTRIYTPSGRIINEKKRLRIPYTFLPAGVFTYTLQGGLPRDEGIKTGEHGLTAGADMAYGITSALTVGAGTDCISFSPFHTRPYVSLSARLFRQYLFHMKTSPGSFWHAGASVTYPNSIHLNLSYTSFLSNRYQRTSNFLHEIKGGSFISLKFSKTRAALRVNVTHQITNSSSSNTRLMAAFNTQLGKSYWRIYYNHRAFHQNLKGIHTGKITAAGNYTFSHFSSAPSFLRGLYLKGEITYSSNLNRFSETRIHLSRYFHGSSRKPERESGNRLSSLWQKGRLSLSVSGNFQTSKYQVLAGLTLDLKPTRTTTRFSASNGTQSFRQTFSGSLALEPKNKRISANNRNQAGKSAVNIVFFIDQNNDGIRNPGEEKVAAPYAVQLNQGIPMGMTKDSMIRISQIQNYRTCNVRIIRDALPEPTLSPKVSRFSFTADPNRTRLLEIPLYRTGIIEGSVTLAKEENIQNPGGVRLKLISKSGEHTQTLRTFHNGTFYAQSLLPGEYALTVDPVQLDFLEAKSIPQKIILEIRALPEGDHQKDLNFTLQSKPKQQLKE